MTSITNNSPPVYTRGLLLKFSKSSNLRVFYDFPLSAFLFWGLQKTYFDFLIKLILTICQKKAKAPKIMMLSPIIRNQRRSWRSGCCIKSSLRANHRPWVTLAHAWIKPIGKRLMRIIKTSPMLRPQKPKRISLSLKAISGYSIL